MSRQGFVERLSFDILFVAVIMMRSTLLIPVLLSTLLAACATTNDASPSKHVSQSGALKIHPGLLGQPVPAELQEAAVKSGAATVSTAAAPPELQMDETGLRTQRSVYFDVDTAAIKAEFNPALRAHGRYLAAHPKSRVRIEGNADERGALDYNSVLGMKRAENVRRSIIAQGASEKQVSIKSLGKLKPKLTGHDEESWAENRRADIVYPND